MTCRHSKGVLWCPEAFCDEGAHAPFLDVEDGLDHTSLPAGSVPQGVASIVPADL